MPKQDRSKVVGQLQTRPHVALHHTRVLVARNSVLIASAEADTSIQRTLTEEFGYLGFPKLVHGNSELSKQICTDGGIESAPTAGSQACIDGGVESAPLQQAPTLTRFWTTRACIDGLITSTQPLPATRGVIISSSAQSPPATRGAQSPPHTASHTPGPQYQ